MGIRFNKRIKLLPYVTMNVGKSGVSFTLGPKGKTLNIGGTGVNVNVSMGKGVGYSKRIITWKNLSLPAIFGMGSILGGKAANAAGKGKGKGKGKKGTTTQTDTSNISLDDAIAEAEGKAAAEGQVQETTEGIQEQPGCGPKGCALGCLAVLVILALIGVIIFLLIHSGIINLSTVTTTAGS